MHKIIFLCILVVQFNSVFEETLYFYIFILLLVHNAISNIFLTFFSRAEEEDNGQFVVDLYHKWRSSLRDFLKPTKGIPMFDKMLSSSIFFFSKKKHIPSDPTKWLENEGTLDIFCIQIYLFWVVKNEEELRGTRKGVMQENIKI